MTNTKTLLWVLVAEQRHWSYKDFERAFAAAATDLAKRLGDRHFNNLTVSEPTFRRWTAGRVGRTAGRSAQVLEHMFHRTAASLLAPAPSLASNEQPQYNLESDIAMTARDASDHAFALASQSLPGMSLEQLRDDLVHLARTYDRRPPFDVFREGKMLRANVADLLDRTQIPAQRQDLLIIAGQAAALLAMSAFDLGSLGSATRLARSAAIYGEAARFGPLQAFAGGTLAVLAYWDGRPAEAVQLVRQAKLHPGIGAAARARLGSIEARAYGHLGDAARAQRAVQAFLNDDWEGVDDLHDGIGGEFHHDAARLARSYGTTFLLLSDGAGAQEHTTRVLTLQSALPASKRTPRIEAEARADCAAALLLTGDLDGAVEMLKPIAALPPDRRIAGLVERIRRVRGLLTEDPIRTSAVAISLGEDLEEYVRASAPRQLGTGATRLALGN
ncbi:DNA-binding protein [Kitasatospora acidiphila]|uniref:DNA-binding protein n=1 Tax=Kitasatospora acidiphila TaxID=2567942 RepID=A0A540VZ15_9ACTN|nr:DNA-binding protein [Kitasatospora acidiphila]TQF01971.1 DNA-binding protein [Kitasatospora acidiphila]